MNILETGASELEVFSGPCRSRTYDQEIKSQPSLSIIPLKYAVYPLSYSIKKRRNRPQISHRLRDPIEDEPRYRWANGEWVKR
jgi:hypothetical protein